MTQMDKRYGTRRWKRTRLIVLRRDGYRCWVQGCEVRANVADHIEPSSLVMPDYLFYALTNLRASCKRHNTARGVAARLEREVEGGVAPLPSDYSYGGRTRFLGSGAGNDRPLVNPHTQQGMSLVVTRDYTRHDTVGATQGRAEGVRGD